MSGLFCLCVTSSFLRSQAGQCNSPGMHVVHLGLANESWEARILWSLLVFNPTKLRVTHALVPSLLIIINVFIIINNFLYYLRQPQDVLATWHGQPQIISYQAYEVGTIIISNLQLKKLRYGAFKQFGQG